MFDACKCLLLQRWMTKAESSLLKMLKGYCLSRFTLLQKFYVSDTCRKHDVKRLSPQTSYRHVSTYTLQYLIIVFNNDGEGESSVNYQLFYQLSFSLYYLLHYVLLAFFHENSDHFFVIMRAIISLAPLQSILKLQYVHTFKLKHTTCSLRLVFHINTKRWSYGTHIITIFMKFLEPSS